VRFSLARTSWLRKGISVKRTGKVMEVPVGPELRGRVVNAIGQPIDGKGPINAKQTRRVEIVCPGYYQKETRSRAAPDRNQGYRCHDPNRQGQRELCIGDRQIGKTAILIDTIINQKGGDVTCIYVAIGQRRPAVVNTVQKLEEMGAMEHTIVVVATASEPAPMAVYSPITPDARWENISGITDSMLYRYDDLTKTGTCLQAALPDPETSACT